jgi:hypothetical protein
MFFSTKLRSNGKWLKILLGHETEARLKGTCFRGRQVAKAGNFLLWESSNEIFETGGFPTLFIDEILDDNGNVEEGLLSCTIEFHKTVGWESTDWLENYIEDEMEVFYPNRHSSAMKIKATSTELKAPRTKLITFVYHTVREDSAMKVIIKSIYPGADIGELKGDVTAREGKVFFDWEHPGE